MQVDTLKKKRLFTFYLFVCFAFAFQLLLQCADASIAIVLLIAWVANIIVFIGTLKKRDIRFNQSVFNFASICEAD